MINRVPPNTLRESAFDDDVPRQISDFTAEIAAAEVFVFQRFVEGQPATLDFYDAAFFGIERPTNVPATQQDRAYTSPVWYTAEE